MYLGFRKGGGGSPDAEGFEESGVCRAGVPLPTEGGARRGCCTPSVENFGIFFLEI